MLAISTELERRTIEEATRLLGGSSRFVDLAVELKAIDGPGRDGVGGRYDTVQREWCGDPEGWPIWKVGQGQMPPLQSEGRFVCVGAMGAGKTEVLARAAICRAMLSPGKAVGVVAPVQKRLQIAWLKLLKLLRPQWVTDIRLADKEVVLVNGCRIQFIAAKMQSKDVGSPIQGYSWVAAFVDEEQDIDEEAMADIAMRGRDAPDGRYPVLSTCTLKDTPLWRTRKQKYDSQQNTTVFRMEATANPFVAPEYWESLKETLTPRQYRMRVLAEDARPERAIYPDFERGIHIKPRPQLGIVDITREITGGALLVGHDPGSLCAVSSVLRCYRIRGIAKPVWWIERDLTTRPGTPGRHAVELAKFVKLEYALKPKDCVIRADPYGNTEESPGVNVYREYQHLGFAIRPTVYKATTNMKDAHRPGRLMKDDRIQCLNALLLNAAGHTRLYFEPDQHGNAKAKDTCGAIEVAEYDEAGRAETERKDAKDRSHWCAAPGYALYPYEHTPPIGAEIRSM